MAYVHRQVEAGQTVEHKKMQSFRVHTKGVQRQPNHGHTSDKQAKINERATEERLRWKLNANFGYRDLHAVLHYFDKERTLEQCREDLALFLKRLRRLCKKKGIPLKYIAVTETKRMTNIHHHVIINRMDAEIIAEAWEGVEGGGGISFRPLDRRGNHYKLAAYLMKESRATMERYKEAGRRGKRYSASQNLLEPKITYTVVSAASWRKDPKAHKGAILYKFDDGSTCKSGWHEISGYPFQEYFEVFNE
jgi:hypothetical protein